MCPFVMIPEIHCVWTGPQTEVKDHIEIYHNVAICEVNELFVDKVPDLGKQNHYHKVISCFNELFFCFWDMACNRYSYSMFYIGPNMIAGHFINKLTLKSGDGFPRINDSWFRRMNFVKQWREPPYRVQIPYSNLSRLHLADEQNSLPFAIEISRAPELLTN
jgi:hypothetical protein